jgi:hypothetical protein
MSRLPSRADLIAEWYECVFYATGDWHILTSNKELQLQGGGAPQRTEGSTSLMLLGLALNTKNPEGPHVCWK